MIWYLLACTRESVAPGTDDRPLPGPNPDDTSPAADTAEDRPADNTFVFAGAVLELTLDLSPEAVAGLATSWTQELPDVHASFGYDGRVWEVGLHLRGARGAFQGFDEKPGFKIDFDQWVDGGRFFGLEHLTLDSLVEDPSMLAARSTFHLFEAVGLPAPRFGYGHLEVNGTDYGLYGLVETLDREFVDRAFPGTAGALFTADADFMSGNEGLFSLVSGKVNGSELTTLFAALDAATDTTLLTVFDTWFTKDALLDGWAIELAIGNPDGFLRRADSYGLHFDQTASRWSLLPWRADRAFYERPDVHGPAAERLYTACRASTACTARLDARLAALATTWEAIDLAGWAAAEGARIIAGCHGDPKNPWGPSGCDQGQGALLDYLRSRPAEVEAALGP